MYRHYIYSFLARHVKAFISYHMVAYEKELLFLPYPLLFCCSLFHPLHTWICSSLVLKESYSTLLADRSGFCYSENIF